MKSNLSLTTISAAEAERRIIHENELDLFVINTNKNNINNNSERVRVQILFGDNQSVLIEDSPIPQNLGDLTNTATLVRDTAFKRAVAIGKIAIVDSKEARKLLASPSVRLEVVRLNNLRADAASNLVDDGNGGFTTQDRLDLSQERPTNKSDEVVGTEVHPLVLKIMADADRQSMEQVYESLAVLPREKLVRNDYNFIAADCEKRGWMKLARWAQNRNLMLMQAEDESNSDFED